MNAPVPQKAVSRLRQSVRRGEVLWWTLGILLVLFGVGVAVSPSIQSGDARTEGTVIRVDRQRDWIQHGNPHVGEMVTYEEVVAAYPVVEYQAGDRKYTLKASTPLAVGQKVPVLYEADRPWAAGIDTFPERWGPRVLIGGVLLISGVVVLLYAAHTQRMFWRLAAKLLGRSQGAEGQKGAGQAATSPAEPLAAPDPARDGESGSS